MFKKGNVVESDTVIVLVTYDQKLEDAFSGSVVEIKPEGINDGFEKGVTSGIWIPSFFKLVPDEPVYSTEQLQKHGSVILEYLKGEVIEVSGDERWEVCDTPFFYTGLEYRVRDWEPNYLDPISLPDGSTRIFVRKVNERFYTLPSDSTGQLVRTDAMFLTLESHDDILELKK